MIPEPQTASPATSMDDLCVNTLRFLSIDAVQKANSGHPGLPPGALAMAYVLWTRFLKHHPANPDWFNRDRFILSAGHGSALLYSPLHMTGYTLPPEQIRQFRQRCRHGDGRGSVGRELQPSGLLMSSIIIPTVSSATAT